MAATVARFSRNISTNGVLREKLSEPLRQSAVSAEHGGSWKMWRQMFFLACCPAMGIAYVNVHLTEETPPPEFKAYPHLRIRNKKYPWRDGVKTLFHDPHRNALPTGYEH